MEKEIEEEQSAEAGTDEAAGGPPTFSLLDDGDDDATAGAEPDTVSNDGARLSAMFEHNDLINNRIAGLAQSIRSLNLPPPRRLSCSMWKYGNFAEPPDEEMQRIALSRRASIEAGQCKDVDEQTTTSATSSSSSAVPKRAEESVTVQALHHRVRKLEDENKYLRSRLSRYESQGTKHDFEPATRVCLPTTSEQVAAEPDSVAKAGWSKIAAAVNKEKRRKQRAHKAAEKRTHHPTAQVEHCESIVDHLLDTIEALKTSVVPPEGAQADEKAEDSASEEQGDGYMAELRGAIGDFFYGLSEVAAPSTQEDAAQSHSSLRDTCSGQQTIMHF